MLSREMIYTKDFTGLKLCEDTTVRQAFGGQKTGNDVSREKRFPIRVLSTVISLITVEVGINVEGVQKLQNQ